MQANTIAAIFAAAASLFSCTASHAASLTSPSLDRGSSPSFKSVYYSELQKEFLNLGCEQHPLTEEGSIVCNELEQELSNFEDGEF